jgi:hypothetical protein
VLFRVYPFLVVNIPQFLLVALSELISNSGEMLSRMQKSSFYENEDERKICNMHGFTAVLLSVATIEKEEGIFIRTQSHSISSGITNNSSTNNGATNNGSIPLDVPKGTGGDIKLLMSPAFRVRGLRRLCIISLLWENPTESKHLSFSYDLISYAQM